jgi:hypothetical protein
MAAYPDEMTGVCQPTPKLDYLIRSAFSGPTPNDSGSSNPIDVDEEPQTPAANPPFDSQRGTDQGLLSIIFANFLKVLFKTFFKRHKPSRLLAPGLRKRVAHSLSNIP